MGNFLEQQAAGGLAVGEQAHEGGELLRLREVVLEDLREVFAFERHHALVDLAASAVFEHQREAAFADQLAYRSGRPGFVVRHAANLEVRCAVGHQQRHRPAAAHLERRAARAFAIGAQQYCERCGLAQKMRNLRRIGATLEHLSPGAGKAYQPAADVELLEEEALDVVGLHCLLDLCP